MKYRGFREETLLAAVAELDALGMKPSEIHAVINLAGAKWRSVQIREGRGDEFQDEEDSRVFHEATVSLMKSTMSETQKLAVLGHASEGERFMLLAISITLQQLFSRGPRLVRDWLAAGEKRKRKVVLAFAMGSSIIVEPQAIDILMHRIVKFRYGVPFDGGKDISAAVISVVDRLGHAGYACLNPIADASG
jgi:hypothetical protein